MRRFVVIGNCRDFFSKIQRAGHLHLGFITAIFTFGSTLFNCAFAFWTFSTKIRTNSNYKPTDGP